MNWTHMHLALNHVPVIGIVFGILLLVVAMIRSNTSLEKVSLGMFVLVALAAVPVYLTGEPAEEAVEHLPGIGEALIDRHEDAAKIALISVEVVGALALAVLLFFRHAAQIPNPVGAAVLLLALASSGVMTWTANLGGQIRHSEIRSDAGTGVDTAHNTDDNDKASRGGKEEDD